MLRLIFQSELLSTCANILNTVYKFYVINKLLHNDGFIPWTYEFLN